MGKFTHFMRRNFLLNKWKLFLRNGKVPLIKYDSESNSRQFDGCCCTRSFEYVTTEDYDEIVKTANEYISFLNREGDSIHNFN